MSKRGYISRYLLIIKRLQKLSSGTFISKAELRDYIQNELESLQLNDDELEIGFSERTLERDFKEIRNLFGVAIEYSPKHKGYYISNSDGENLNFKRMIESFEIFNFLNISNDLSEYVILENRRMEGTENFFGLLHAVKNCCYISFEYQKYWESESTSREVEPYALKEFRNRWYILAKDLKDGNIKSFALDRLSSLEISKRRFSVPNRNEIIERYHNCYGIISPNDDKIPEVVLSFSTSQGNYIKSLPIHFSQKALIDNNEEYRISLQLYITYDFIMELLSYGKSVKVIKPQWLIDKVKLAYQQALEQY